MFHETGDQNRYSPAVDTLDDQISRADVLTCEATLAICSELTDTLQKDCFVESVEEEDSWQDPSQPRSTVGILLNGLVIDDIVLGGPAFNAEQIDKGDTILRVDDIDVTAETVQRALIGTDKPESTVSIVIKKGPTSNSKREDSNPLWYLNSAVSSSSTIPSVLRDRNENEAPMRTVEVVRMRSASVADRRRMSELFTIMKVRTPAAAAEREVRLSNCISLQKSSCVLHGRIPPPPRAFFCTPIASPLLSPLLSS
jgi:hypothetical protein